MRYMNSNEHSIGAATPEGAYPVLVKPGVEMRCPICQELLDPHQYRLRHIRFLDGEREDYIVEDRLCAGCGSSHRLLPDVATPYKHFATVAIVEIIESGDELFNDYDNLSEQTVNRLKNWWSSMLAYFAGVVASVCFKFGLPLKKTAPLLEYFIDYFHGIVRAAVNSCCWTFPTQFDLSPG